MKLKDLVYSFSGGDHVIIKQCDDTIKMQFLATGLFVPVVFMLCFISSIYTFNQVFDTVVMSLFFALFFSWMITNIYRFLLCTLAKDVLPHPSRGGSVQFSTAIRLCFVCFIALLIAKPIETMLYTEELNTDIDTYKAEVKKNNQARILLYYSSQVSEIKHMANDKAYVQQFNRDRERDRIMLTTNMYRLVDGSGYYLQRIRFLNTKHRSCWLITTLFIAIFVFPIVYIKYRMRHSSYYNVKTTVEKNMVEEAYADFKEEFTAVFEDKYNKKVMYSEHHLDAPYNTIRKKDERHFYTEEKFLSELYDA